MYVDTTASVTWTTYDDVTASDVSADVTVMWNCTPYPHHQDVSDVVEVFCGRGGGEEYVFPRADAEFEDRSTETPR